MSSATCLSASRCSAVIRPRSGSKTDYPFQETAIFERPGFPRLAFIEHCYAGDDTNWWIPNRACTAAMLRSAGFVIDGNPEEEVFICRPGPAASQRAVYPARPKGRGNGAMP